MGCDIHIRLEVKESGKWKVPQISINKIEEYETISWGLHNRNYALFGMLAGVRNRYGFEPIAEKRGLPNDVTDEVKLDYEEYGCDAHSASHCTVQELIDNIARLPIINESGMVSPEQAKALDVNGEIPTSWCQGTNQKDYVYREWNVENYALQNYIDKLINIKSFLNIDCSNDDFRIVFWFDN